MEVKVLPEINHSLEIKTNNNDFPKILEQSIKKIIKSEGYLKCEINKRCLSTDGGNYLGSLYEIDVKGKTKEGNKETNIFVKQIIDVDFLNVFSISNLYNSEIFVYKELSKIFEGLQEIANVPREERYKMVKAYEESNTEAIILENLSKSGFKTYDRMDVVPIQFVELSVKHLARFHALSFVLREKNPEYFETNIKPLKYPVTFNDNWLKLVKIFSDGTINNVDEKFKDKLEKLYEDLVIKYVQYNNDESIKACLCHGDYRANNIMVKIKKGEIQEIIPVDYQIINYGCPIFDFLYLIFTGTDREFRKIHLSNLKDLYYETLTNFLKYFDLDADIVYPRKEFDKIYKEKLDYGLMIAMLFFPFIFVSEEEVSDISKEQSEGSRKFDDRFKDRMKGVIEDFMDWGYI